MCYNFQKNTYSDIYLKKYSWGIKMKKKMNKVDLKIDEKTHWKGSLTNQHVRKEDPRQMTADHFIVGVSPMARTTIISSITRPSKMILF